MSRRPKTQRRRLFDLHSWLGYNLALFMTLVIFTGTVAVISDEIDWLIHTELRASERTEDFDWGRFDAAVRAARPEATVTALAVGEEPYFNARAILIDPTGKRYFLYVDPVSYTVAGTTGTLTVQRFFRDLHRYLFMPSILGLPLVTTMAVVLLISLYTGLKTVRNWRTVASRVRIDRGARVAVGDFHKAAGLWGIWFFVIIIVTSFWYFAELMSYAFADGFEPNRPGITEERTQSLGRTAKPASVEELIDAATGAHPGLRPQEIFLALRPNQAVTVTGRHDDPLVRNRSNRVFLDPIDASVVKVQRSADISWPAYLNDLADPLHFGDFGGLYTKLIWFVFGLTMFSLSLTGVWLTWKRLKTRQPTRAQWANVPLLVIVAAFGVPYVQRHIEDPDSVRVIGRQTVEQLDITLAQSISRPEQLRVRVSTSNGRVNLTEVELTPRGANPEDAVRGRGRFIGPSATAELRLDSDRMLGAFHFDVLVHFSGGKPINARFANPAHISSNEAR